jgi:hypothetical protein
MVDSFRTLGSRKCSRRRKQCVKGAACVAADATPSDGSSRPTELTVPPRRPRADNAFASKNVGHGPNAKDVEAHLKARGQ